MNTQFEATLRTLRDIKADIGAAIIEKGGNLNGIQFAIWGNILAGLNLGSGGGTDGTGGTGGSIDWEERALRRTPVYWSPVDAQNNVSRRMSWMDAVDASPDKTMWVPYILVAYSGTGNPPYSQSVALYGNATYDVELDSPFVLYSDGKVYTALDTSFYEMQGEIQGSKIASMYLVRQNGNPLDIPRVNPELEPGQKHPLWDRFPVFCLGEPYVFHDREVYNIDSAERCGLVTELVTYEIDFDAKDSEGHPESIGFSSSSRYCIVRVKNVPVDTDGNFIQLAFNPTSNENHESLFTKVSGDFTISEARNYSGHASCTISNNQHREDIVLKLTLFGWGDYYSIGSWIAVHLRQFSAV